MKLLSKLKRGFFLAALAFVATVGHLPAMANKTAPTAEEKGPLQVQMKLQRVVLNAKNEETLVEAPEVRPGDLLEYRVVYTNVSSKTLHDVLATLPVPEGTLYQGRSAQPVAVMATTTGSDFQAVPLTRKVRSAQGKEESQFVPYGEYRALRWRLSAVEPGKSITVSARVLVAPSSPSAGKSGSVVAQAAAR